MVVENISKVAHSIRPKGVGRGGGGGGKDVFSARFSNLTLRVNFGVSPKGENRLDAFIARFSELSLTGVTNDTLPNDKCDK